MKICIIGTGYVGLVSGVCFSELGHFVTCVDLNEEKINKLKKGLSPIYEPGIENLIQKNLNTGRLKFTTELKHSVEETDIIFITVGTPSKENGEADLSYVEEAAMSIGKSLSNYKIIVMKSTVPVGTGKKIKKIIQKLAPSIDFDIASVPEFLREGSAIDDTFNMDRVVIGTESKKAKKILVELHKPFTSNFVLTNIETAEMIKYASNAFLATKISFINEIANFCELVGADVTKVAEGMGYDKRIGKHFLNAGIGYGGSCFPKDTSALTKMAEKAGYNFRIIKDVEKVNKDQRMRIIKKINKVFNNNLIAKRIAVLGLTFKPNTDDMRDAPSLDIIPILKNSGADVVAYDPIANEVAKKYITNLKTANTLDTAVKGADAIVILTDWSEFKEMNLEYISKLMKQKIIIDGRNIFSLEIMEQIGFYYDSIGRQIVNRKK